MTYPRADAAKLILIRSSAIFLLAFGDNRELHRRDIKLIWYSVRFDIGEFFEFWDTFGSIQFGILSKIREKFFCL